MVSPNPTIDSDSDTTLNTLVADNVSLSTDASNTSSETSESETSVTPGDVNTSLEVNSDTGTNTVNSEEKNENKTLVDDHSDTNSTENPMIADGINATTTSFSLLVSLVSNRTDIAGLHATTSHNRLTITKQDSTGIINGTDNDNIDNQVEIDEENKTLATMLVEESITEQPSHFEKTIFINVDNETETLNIELDDPDDDHDNNETLANSDLEALETNKKRYDERHELARSRSLKLEEVSS